MVIVLTGTPGTGKTSVAEELNWPTIDLTQFVKNHNLGEQEEEFEVHVEEMVEALHGEVEKREKESDGKVLIEGHLAHHYPADYCVVLRTDPDILRERLKTRGYPEEKIEENIEAEMLDSVLIEAVEKQENIIEIDTTDKEVKGVAEEIKRSIKRNKTGYGDIDWSSRV